MLISTRLLPSLNCLRFMTLSFLFLMLSGCGGVSEKQQEKIAQIVVSTSPQFEQETQQLLASDKRLSKLRNGEWKWDYKKGDKGKFLAEYGYKGDLPWWKSLWPTCSWILKIISLEPLKLTLKRVLLN